MKISKKDLLSKIVETNGRFFSVRLLKKDGVVRDMNCRKGITKFLVGGKRTHPAGLVSVYDIKNKGYRYVNLDTAISA